MEVSLPALLARGDCVSITEGRLHIIPASGNTVPQEWLEGHSEQLIREILQAVSLEAYTYESYSTGLYGPHMAGGVTLQFSSLLDGHTAYAVFNAELKRARGERKGSPLPKGRFRVGKRSHFYEFWRCSGLKLPRRLSAFHECMGKLRGIVFSGRKTEHRKGRLVCDSLKPLTVRSEWIKRSLRSDKVPTKSQQSYNKVPTRTSDKDSPQDLAQQELEQDPTTCRPNYENKDVREHVTRDSSNPMSQSPKDQTTDEWLADYGEVLSDQETIQ